VGGPRPTPDMPLGWDIEEGGGGGGATGGKGLRPVG